MRKYFYLKNYYQDKVKWILIEMEQKWLLILFTPKIPVLNLWNFAKRNYLYAHTELESTNPRHIERYESLKIFIKNYFGLSKILLN